MKRLVSLTLCILLILSMAAVGMVTAFAEEIPPTGTVTIHKKIEEAGKTVAEKEGLDGSEFSFYKIMSLDNGAWKLTENFKDVTSLKTYAENNLIQKTTSANDGYVSYGTTTELEELVGDLAVVSASKNAEKTVVTATVENVKGIAKAEGLTYGIYLVVETKPSNGYIGSSQPFLVSVTDQTMTDGNIDVYPKNEPVSIEKKIGNSAEPDKAVMKATYAIGDSVPFFIKSKTPNYDTDVLDSIKTDSADKFNALTVKLSDTFSAGLTLNLGEGDTDEAKLKAAFDVKIDGRAFSSYTVAKNEAKYEITINVSDLYKEGVNLLNKDITVDYSATLNEKAIVGTDGNPNDASIKFKTNPLGTEDEIDAVPPVVYTYQFELTKLLNGAAFSGTDEASFKLTKVEETAETDVKVTGENGSYTVSQSGDAIETITTKGGKFTVKGLDNGLYKLTETEGVEGYAKLEVPITIYVEEVNENGSLTAKVNAYTYKNNDKLNLTKADVVGVFAIEVNNPNNQFNLPLTGSNGVLVCILCGAGAFAVAAVLFILARKKKNK